MSSKLDRLFYIPFLIVVLAAISDLIGCYAFNVAGWNETYWWSYANAVYVLWYSFPIILGIVYYILQRDISESLALSIGTIILFAFGFEDLFFFILSPIVTAILGIPNYAGDYLVNPLKPIPWLDFPKMTCLVQPLFFAKHCNLILLTTNTIFGLLVYWLFFELMKKINYILYIRDIGKIKI